MKYDKINDNSQLSDQHQYVEGFCLDLDKTFFKEETIDILDFGEVTRKAINVPVNFFFIYEAEYKILLINQSNNEVLERSSTYCDINKKLLSSFDNIVNEDIEKFKNSCNKKYGSLLEKNDDLVFKFKISIHKNPYLLKENDGKYFLKNLNGTFRIFSAFRKTDNSNYVSNFNDRSVVTSEIVKTFDLYINEDLTIFNSTLFVSKADLFDELKTII